MRPHGEGNMTTETPQASEADIFGFLQTITEGWEALSGNPMIEIRCISTTRSTTSALFPLVQIDDAVEHAYKMNAAKQNVYVCVNPVDGKNVLAGKAAKDTDIMAAFFCFADADDDGAMQNILSFAGPKFTMSVKTGTKPFVRGHAYWRLEDPVYNLDAWRDMQKRIAASLKTDPMVVNPSRIMRVAGTVSWPNADKQAKGYVPELVTYRTEFSQDRDPVEFDRMLRAFPVQDVSRHDTSSGLQIDLGKQAMDRALAQQNILQGNDWHHNVVRLVGSYVSRGLSDDEIHELTDKFTLAGYTVDDTRREVQKAIDGARDKGWTPPPDPMVQRLEQSVPTPSLEDATPSDAAGQASPAAFEWPTPVGPINELLLPRRHWIYSRTHIRGFVSVTASAGGIGKTSLTMVEALAVAANRPLLGENIYEQCNVWVINLEDDMSEMMLRLAAAMKHYNVSHEDIAGKLFMDAEDTIELIMGAETRDGLTLNDALLEVLMKRVKDNSIGLVIIDPFVSTHLANENSNSSIQAIVAMFRKLAREANCAVHIVHHVRKGNGEDATIDSVRGAGSLIGAARVARVINKVSEEDAINAGVPQSEALGLFRIDNGKANLAPPSDKAVYRRMVSVELANNELIGVATEYKLPDVFDGITTRDAMKVQQAIGNQAEGDPARSNPQAKNWAGYTVAEVLNLDPDADKGRIKSILKTWVNKDVLRVEYLPDKRTGRDVPCVVVGEWISWSEC